VLRRISGEVTGEWRKLHKEELHDLHCSPNIWVMESRRMRWAGHVEWEELDCSGSGKEQAVGSCECGN
jgi:hypothetical protein